MDLIELDPAKRWGMVAYTDGGAQPNPGASGNGLHGYVYVIGEEDTKKKPWKFTANEVIKYALPCSSGYKYTDKDGKFSSSRDSGATVVFPRHIFEMARSSSGQFTNNYAEAYSLYHVLITAQALGVKQVMLVLDSEYSLNCIQKWCAGWAKNGWRTGSGEPVKNVELWQSIWERYCKMKDDGVSFGFGWVKGHAGHPGNNQADHLASIGVMKSRLGMDDERLEWFTVKDYFEPKRDRHPLLSLKRIYFDRLGENYEPGKYYMADPGKDDALIGKPTPETVYAVVKMKEEHPTISAVIKKQHHFHQDFNAVMMIKTEALFVPDVFRMIQSHGEYAMRRARSGPSVQLIDERPLTLERKPVGITMRAVDCLNDLDNRLDQFLKNVGTTEVEGPDFFQIHSLTDTFYEYETKNPGKSTEFVKQTLKKEFGVGYKDLKVKLDLVGAKATTTREVLLKLALDMPDRNALKQLETEDVTVDLITWRDSELSVRYATVIRCTAGMAIWSNFYADRIILKE